ncbi:adenylate/guanylate cyclase domain-containing protein [Corallococcus terminator]|uniref:Adenylate/guanylate cyclase domain-containing protein n=1 Tax=Corallococcus terminator TaxID=2316733 RepID=A0A3A8IL89_9BACT|nr:adenylate/guanylate cyclase domain-containing protein [Corallococcus terminator]RKG83226.1 adenylate/guanylate cyclase domain-containing protein [Corallococcus terminator]
MKTANLAIVFTDIKGFTERTSRQTLEENQRLLQVHEALLAPLFRAFGGRIIKTIGDAFLVTFESPTQAVLSGIAIQDQLWHHNRLLLPDDQLHVRVAVNVGEVRVEANDIFGEPVNIAARVEGITDADEVFFTEAVYLAMNKAEVPSQEVGAFELKGIPGKIRVFRVPRAPYRVEAPSPGLVVSEEEAAALPPFGNLALSRVSEEGMDLSALGHRAAEGAAQFGQGAAQLGQRAAGGAVVLGQKAASGAVVLGQKAAGGAVVLGQRAAEGAVVVGQKASVLGRQAHTAGSALWARGREAHAQMTPEQRKKWTMLAAAVGVLLLGLVAVLWVRGAPMRAITAVEGTAGMEKTRRSNEAQKYIDSEKDAGRRLYLSGRLSEAQGNVAGAMGDYSQAAKKGNDDAVSRVVTLLEHENCWTRVAAVRTAAELKLEDARSTLETLAESGGDDDGRASGNFFKSNCDSKKAAESALKRLDAN